MEKYLMEGSVTDDELAAALPKALAAGTVVPDLLHFGQEGHRRRRAARRPGRPAPCRPLQGKQRTAIKGEGDKAAEVTLAPDPAGEFVGQVFKALTDKFVGNLSFIRVYSGKYQADQPLFNVRTGKSARTGGLLLMQGKQQKTDDRGHPRRHRRRGQGRGPAHRRHGQQPRRRAQAAEP